MNLFNLFFSAIKPRPLTKILEYLEPEQNYKTTTAALFINLHTIMRREAHNRERHLRWSAGKIWAGSDAGPPGGNSSAAE